MLKFIVLLFGEDDQKFVYNFLIHELMIFCKKITLSDFAGSFFCKTALTWRKYLNVVNIGPWY